MPGHSTLELRIQSTTAEQEFRLVVEWSRSDGLPIRCERTFTLDHEDLRGLDEPRRYGVALGRVLFVDRVRELFAQARVEASELRVLLAVEARALQLLRWERLAAPFGDDWLLLSHSQRTPFSLYLPSGNDRRFPPFGRRDLRALVVVANPEPDNGYGVDPFDEAAALDTVLEGLGEIPSTVLGTDPRAEGPPTLREVGRRLTIERYTLIHVVCHGAYSPRTGETAMFLHGHDGKTCAVKATHMIQGFKELGTVRGLPHFAFLAVCDSAKPEAEGALGGLGQRLVRELGMPAVVAMTERVSQATAFALGRGLYARLREHGEIDRALVEACIEVRSSEDSVVPALFSRLAGRPLFSDDLDRPLTHTEIVAVADLLVPLFRERAPVLEALVQELAAAVAVDPATLTQAASRERQQSLTELEHLCERVLELSFSALAHGREPPLYDIRCPFPGLRAFTAEQREYFRGRDALVDRLLRQLDQRPFLAVLGNSGCGKSSLVMAGVVPRLQDISPGLQVVQLQPGDHPLAKLEEALEQLEGVPESLIYVDQFEEAFTLCRAEIERKAFFDRLLDVVAPRRRVIISMRADFIGECAQHRGLREQIEGLRLIPPMSADELRNAIEAQGNAVGLRYETGLCELILDDLKEEPGAMPLLQHALQELYERRHGRWLRVEAYEELGRVQKAITQTAENVWGRLEDVDKERLRAIMLELTEVREAEGGGSVRYLRRRVPLAGLYYTRAATIAPWAGISDTSEAPAIQRLVDLLADERLLVKSRDEAMGDDVVEVAHEALLRGWERLQQWLAAARDSIRMRQDLEQAAARWRANDLAQGYLVHVHERGERVRSFLREGALKLDPRLKEYFKACEAEERRQREEKEKQQQEKLEAAQRLAREQSRRAQQLRRSAFVVTAVGALAVMAAIWAFMLFGQANEAKADAEQQADLARAAEVDAEQQAELARAAEAVADTKAHEAEESLKRQKGVMAELMADQPGERDEAVFQAIMLAKAAPLHVERLPIEVRRALFASTQGLHAVRELKHAEDLPVVDVTFSPDSERVVTAGRDDTAKIWAVRTGELLATLEGHQGDVESVAFVPQSEGKQLITAGRDGTTRLWTVEGKPLDFIEPEGHVTAAIFSPDHHQVATAVRSGAVTIWTQEFGLLASNPVLAERGSQVVHMSYAPEGSRLLVAHADATARILQVGAKPVRTHDLLGHDAPITAAVFGPEGMFVFTGDAKGKIRLWDAQRGTLLDTYEGTGKVQAIVFSVVADRIAVALERSIVLWDVTRRERVDMLRGHRAQIEDIGFSPNGRLLASVSQDKTLRLWNARTGAVAGVLEGHTDKLRRLAFSADGWWIATAAEDGFVRLWLVEPGTQDTLLVEREVEVQHVAFCADGTRVAMATEEGTTLWSLSDQSSVELQIEYLTDVMAWSPDGTQIVTVGEDHTPRVWDTGTGELAKALPEHDSRIDSMAFSPDGSRLATGDARGIVRLFDMRSNDPPVEPLRAHRVPITTLAFSADGRRLATSSPDKTVRLWDLDDLGQEIGSPLKHDNLIYAVAFSPGGEHVATGDSIGRVWQWRIGSDEPPVRLSGHLAAVNAIVFSPDGQRMVTVGTDAVVRLWDTKTHEEIFILGAHARDIVAARFVDEGRGVLSGSIDGVVRRWVVDPQQRMNFACKAVEGVVVDRPEVREICDPVLEVAIPAIPRRRP
ncbi:MAG: CHAT domain-containing protein [Myxococcota bacterium]